MKYSAEGVGIQVALISLINVLSRKGVLSKDELARDLMRAIDTLEQTQDNSPEQINAAAEMVGNFIHACGGRPPDAKVRKANLTLVSDAEDPDKA